jgi:DNA invertase Pin-like site-specific DNA recombinase
VRTSTRDGRQDVTNQLRELRRFARVQGWKITAEYVDRVSGTLSPDGRPALAEMLAAATQGKFDVLLFWSLDRLSREGALETLKYLASLQQYGVRYRSYTQPFFDTAGPFRDALIAILAALASTEQALIRDRVRAGISRAKARGVKFGRPRTVVDSSKLAERQARGDSYRKIAAAAGVSVATAYRRVKAYRRRNGLRPNSNAEHCRRFLNR